MLLLTTGCDYEAKCITWKTSISTPGNNYAGEENIH